ncbi:MAG: hypothetical protein ACR2PV_02415 [Gammaproteobacteria bacterium]
MKFSQKNKHTGKIAAILLWSLIFHIDANAYIDPGSGAVIITAILGAIGAISYTCRKYYQKFKNFFSKKKDD